MMTQSLLLMLHFCFTFEVDLCVAAFLAVQRLTLHMIRSVLSYDRDHTQTTLGDSERNVKCNCQFE